MGASTAPVTAQASIALSLIEEQPTSLTHFGQGPDVERGRLFEERRNSKASPTSWIDIVEPIQAPAPAEAPKSEHAPAAPAKGQARPMPVLSPAAVDAVFELFDANELTGRFTSRANHRARDGKSTWNLSSLFGTAVVVIGGYRIGIHGSNRINGQFLPRQPKSKRWTWR
jgi:hypothetical protein